MLRSFFWTASLAGLCLVQITAGAASFRLETQTLVNGTRRPSFYALVFREEWSLGTTVLWDLETGPTAMGGINSPLFCVGHLTDSGLAAEIRNPECRALGRLSERTAFRADIRSYSTSRIGIVLSDPENRYAVAWQRQPTIDSGLIWIEAFDARRWSLEILAQAGLLRRDGIDTDWYPDEYGNPGGPFATAAVRSRFDTGRFSWSITGITSSGRNFRPGYLLAAAAQLDSGPFRMRLRCARASEFYRNAEGSLPEIPFGLSWDAVLKPNIGPWLCGAFTLALYQGEHESIRDEEDCRIGFGWSLPRLQFRSSLFWNGLTVNPVSDKLSGSIEWSSGSHLLSLELQWFFANAWELGFRWEYDCKPGWTLGISSTLHREHRILIDAGFRFIKIFNDSQLALEVSGADIPRDWTSGSLGSSDFELSLRWSFKRND